MRIISGTLGGRKLTVPDSAIRPSSDRVRSGMFSALESVRPCHGQHVLDLYAGSGALGIEALSRGAASALFVESDPRAAAAMESNLTELRLVDRARVQMMPVERFLASPSAETFEMIFADPPYQQAEAKLLEQLAAARVVRPGSILVFETAKNFAPAGVGWTVIKEKPYGDTVVRFFLFTESDRSQS